MGMSEEDVKKQLNQMVNFIKREAEEKAQEIIQKAEEEFSIEKHRLVTAEKLKIMKEFENKSKQVEVERKIHQSNALNQSRLKVLKAREDSVHQVFQAARRKLLQADKRSDYPELLHKLILQGLIQFGESDVSVQCREVDKKILSSDFLSKVAKEYEQLTSKKVKLNIDSTFLPPPPPSVEYEGESCCGGIVLSAEKGRILCDNTLDQRLRLAYEQLLPDVRKMLFGRSLTRKYFT
eukprot:TRINITY_DN1380_c0_g1_i1.p1 TRINITY_DN1380_c0_g1~~TRINITY_DN1380_c0_g1_i1.p1  ORF type:complete len:255 (-),score=78.65 TRINITY_DN1380_c0_g1_i1:147-854(-)